MKKRFFVRLVLLSATSMAGLAACAMAANLPLASAAAPSASASASAAAAAPAGPPVREPRPEPLEKAAIPEAKSTVPTLEEWKTATVVEVWRRHYRADDCKVLRVREWLKVKCDLAVGAIHQHAGSPEGVAFWIHPKPELYANLEEKNPGELIIPLRKGDRRLLQFFLLERDSCGGLRFEPSVMVDETWLEGEAAPTVVLR